MVAMTDLKFVDHCGRVGSSPTGGTKTSKKKHDKRGIKQSKSNLWSH